MKHLEIGEDFVIKKIAHRQMAGGAWVVGSIHGHRFEALVFPGHAENSSYEIGDSRISKLWVIREKDREPVFNWDRGLDIQARTDVAKEIVSFLCSRVAEATYPAK